MAYVSVASKGYELTAGYGYSGIVDNSADYPSVPNDSYFYDKSSSQVLYKDANGGIYGAYYGGTLNTNNYNTSATQWNTTLPSPVPLPNGDTANGFTFFDNVTDKSSAGTTSYNEYNIWYGRSITLSGTSGSANINVNGTNYLITFATDLFTSADNWVTTNQATLNAIGIQVFALGSGADGRIRFGALADTILNAITITNVTTNLSGTIANEFTGSATASGDHIVVPYVDTTYNGARIFHFIRANFNIIQGSVQYCELGLYRWQNDSLIGSAIQIVRNNDVTGQQVTIVTYTASATDSFVTGGFYLALINNTGTTLEFETNAGVLVENVFDKAYAF